MSLAETAKSADTAFQSIPIIDLQNLRNADLEARKVFASDIRDACINVGFFYVTNHGIPEVVIEEVLSSCEEFFHMPLETKMKIENKKSPDFMGYSPLFSGKNDPDTDGDLQEGFEFGWEDLLSGDTPPTDGFMSRKNTWPEDMPTFRSTALNYYHSLVNLGKLMFPLFAMALDLPEDFFADKTKTSAALMRLLYYPPQSGPVDDRVMGIGAHTDWECFTILWQEPGKQALQVLNSSKQWIDAPPIPGTFVINLGDQFARWTNDVFKSNVHRAINRTGIERYSIPLFFGTDYDVRLEPIPTCISPDSPPKYEVITAGEYVKTRLAATYGH